MLSGGPTSNSANGSLGGGSSDCAASTAVPMIGSGNDAVSSTVTSEVATSLRVVAATSKMARITAPKSRLRLITKPPETGSHDLAQTPLLARMPLVARLKPKENQAKKRHFWERQSSRLFIGFDRRGRNRCERSIVFLSSMTIRLCSTPLADSCENSKS